MNAVKAHFRRDNQSVALHPHGEDTGGSAVLSQALACLSPSPPPFSQPPLGSPELPMLIAMSTSRTNRQGQKVGRERTERQGTLQSLHKIPRPSFKDGNLARESMNLEF